ncbi:hypothetical protein Fmac_026922 [Flemingia macrophylla]|uniref:FAD/NAD(P)-binding domain-containing protein n=1 Tax=Flemingia macrophylla TaxID=520843 RepID=A0ABD1LG81_9FABA
MPLNIFTFSPFLFPSTPPSLFLYAIEIPPSLFLSTAQTPPPFFSLSCPATYIRSDPAAHTAALYTARAKLKLVFFEGWMANDIALDGQLTITIDIKNFLGFLDDMLSGDLMEHCREQSQRFGTKIHTETVSKVDFSTRPFRVFTDSRTIKAEAVIVATGVVAKHLSFIGSSEGPEGYWTRSGHQRLCRARP